jgi:hypothetical protein
VADKPNEQGANHPCINCTLFHNLLNGRHMYHTHTCGNWETTLVINLNTLWHNFLETEADPKYKP